ncbi:hypothetical protein BB558_003337 [Smittium angustum]|uniref:Uncharacterized protein n=1 Tax=Smittium angustum TaxID=133377 RepID=A0A2U1J6M3_SMIAN|nr:hypothetical protein BB558_003337 [Smittium angustum]
MSFSSNDPSGHQSKIKNEYEKDHFSYNEPSYFNNPQMKQSPETQYSNTYSEANPKDHPNFNNTYPINDIISNKSKTDHYKRFEMAHKGKQDELDHFIRNRVFQQLDNKNSISENYNKQKSNQNDTLSSSKFQKPMKNEIQDYQNIPKQFVSTSSRNEKREFAQTFTTSTKQTNKNKKSKPRVQFKIKPANFAPVIPLNLRNVCSNYGKRETKETILTRYANKLDEIDTGENVIVIHPGSTLLRIGLASDPMPHEIPHVIARRINRKHQQDNSNSSSPQNIDSQDTQIVPEKSHKINLRNKSNFTKNSPNIKSVSPENNEITKDSDENNENEDIICGLIDMLAGDLRKRQRETKRKPVPNSLAQVLSYNKSVSPEIIHDHNDPYRVEWIDPSIEQDTKPKDVYFGEQAINLINNGDFIVRMPIKRGIFNTTDYSSIEEVIGDIQEIWSYAIQQVMGISLSELYTYYVVLAIPDLFSRNYIELLMHMLLVYMNFGAATIHQSSVLVTFGAGISNACVIDVGAQKTTVSCVEDGICLPDTRINIKYGGDDITRFLSDLLNRDLFPYRELDLNRMYDWNLMNQLKERHITFNLSDVNIRIYDFYVRAPKKHTGKYSFKVYDEMYLAPWCLFYPDLVNAYSVLPNWKNTFIISQSTNSILEEPNAYPGDIFTPTQFGKLPSSEILEETVASIEEKQGDEPINVTEGVLPIIPSSDLQAQKNGNNLKKLDKSATPNPPSTPSKGLELSTKSVEASAPETPNSLQTQVQNMVNQNAGSTTVGQSTTTMVSTRVYDQEAVEKLMPLDEAITHSIAHTGGIDRVKKFYTSIVIVGGGISFIPDINVLLQDRLFLLANDFYNNEKIDKIEIFPSPRDLDPRVMVWKGGAVYSRLDIMNEMWVTSNEYREVGIKLVKDRTLFQWQ